MINTETLLQILGGAVPLSSLVVVTILVYAIYPEKIEKWAALLSRLFSAISKKHERRSVSLDIQRRVHEYIKNPGSHKILKYGLKIHWVTNEKDSAYVDNDDVVIIMKQHTNNAENFLNAIIQYTSVALLPDVKNEIPQDVMSAIELTLQEKIIREKRPDAMTLFQNNVLSIKISNDKKIEQLVKKFKRLDTAGWFDKIYISELDYAGSRLRGLSDIDRNTAVTTFLAFLITLAKKPGNQEVPLYFKNSVFHLQIILVAKKVKRDLSLIRPYIEAAKFAAKNQCDSLYVMGSGYSVQFTNKIINKIKSRKIGYLVWNEKHEGIYGEKTELVEIQLSLFRNLTTEY